MYKIEILENLSFNSYINHPQLVLGSQSVLKNIKHEQALRIGNHCRMKNCEFGRFWGCDDFCAATDVKYGSFVSVGKNVTFNAGRHQTDYLSTHLMFFNSEFWGEDRVHRSNLSKEEKYYNWRMPMIVGSDVWVGSNATLITGITIGNGAIVGANSVVTKNVESFSIVAGNPARHIRYRFNKDIIMRIEASEWWNLPLEQIRQLPVTNVERALSLLKC